MRPRCELGRKRYNPSTLSGGMVLQHTRDYDHGYVKASSRGSGYLVYIPKGLIELLPDGDELCEAETLEVKRYASNSRNHVQLTLREAQD